VHKRPCFQPTPVREMRSSRMVSHMGWSICSAYRAIPDAVQVAPSMERRLEGRQGVEVCKWCDAGPTRVFQMTD